MHNETALIERLLHYDASAFDSIRRDVKEYIRHNRDCEVHAHPLSFYRLTICSNECFDLRLHAWLNHSQSEPNGESNIHSHTWNLNSLILSGELVNRVYKFKESPKSGLEVFEIVYGNAGSERKSLNRNVAIASVTERTLRKGDVYSLPAACFHSTEVALHTSVLTIVVAEKLARQSAFVVLPSDSPQTLLFPKKLLSQASAGKVVEEILTLLD